MSFIVFVILTAVGCCWRPFTWQPTVDDDVITMMNNSCVCFFLAWFQLKLSNLQRRTLKSTAARRSTSRAGARWSWRATWDRAVWLRTSSSGTRTSVWSTTRERPASKSSAMPHPARSSLNGPRASTRATTHASRTMSTRRPSSFTSSMVRKRKNSVPPTIYSQLSSVIHFCTSSIPSNPLDFTLSLALSLSPQQSPLQFHEFSVLYSSLIPA